MAISLVREFNYEFDLNKVIKMLVIHELEEVVIGDITPYDHITEQEKQEQGHKAIISVIGDLVNKDELVALILEFDERKTMEAQFAYHCDKLEADLQAKVYEDMGCQHLTNQDNNVVMGYPMIQQVLNNGVKLVFEVWYETDKNKYSDDKVFMKTLDYAKDHNTNDIKKEQ